MNYSSLEPLSSTDKRAEKYPCAAKFVGAASHHIVVGIGEADIIVKLSIQLRKVCSNLAIQHPLLEHELIYIFLLELLQVVKNKSIIVQAET